LVKYKKAQRKAEGLGNNNRKTMIKVKTTGQILTFKNGTALPSPSLAACSPKSALPINGCRNYYTWPSSGMQKRPLRLFA